MVNPKLIGRGGTAEVFTWEKDQVLKLFFDWVPSDWIDRETELAKRVSESSLPTPKFIGATSYSGRRGIVYERVEGVSMLHTISSTPWLITRQARIFASLHTQINRENGKGLAALKTVAEQKIKSVEALPARIKLRALEILERLPDGESLCHYDFHPDQVILGPQGKSIIDWMSALKGAPEADVAHTANLLTLARPPKSNWVLEKAIDLARGSFFRAYRAETILLRQGFNWETVELWRIPMAAARLQANIVGESEALLNYLRMSTGIAE